MKKPIAPRFKQQLPEPQPEPQPKEVLTPPATRRRRERKAPPMPLPKSVRSRPLASVGRGNSPLGRL